MERARPVQLRGLWTLDKTYMGGLEITIDTLAPGLW